MRTDRIIVTGKVQGVYFRVSAKQKALNLGLNGYVKNRSDGSVVMEVEGDENAVEDMKRWCSHGPALARVNEVRSECVESMNYPGFEIRK